MKTLSEQVEEFTRAFNAQARETALNDPRAMNAWSDAKKLLLSLQGDAQIIDRVAKLLGT